VLLDSSVHVLGKTVSSVFTKHEQSQNGQSSTIRYRRKTTGFTRKDVATDCLTSRCQPLFEHRCTTTDAIFITPRPASQQTNMWSSAGEAAEHVDG
jgi:hypothetical protein